MKTRINQPKIMLLSCALEFERRENQLSNFEMLTKQEETYVAQLISRIVSLKPDIVLVEKTVSRLAQEKLRESNISLIINVKPSLMVRIARATGATILQSPTGILFLFIYLLLFACLIK